MYTPDWTVAPLYLWVVYNIPAEIKMMPDDGDIPDDAVLGLNYANENLYRGPCPPDAKIHHYIFDLFALDTVLPPDPNADGETVMAAMRKHILQETKLIGSFNH
jgi:Raf kinase inhibitor-like YbhB/YbcL family protein